MAHKMLIDATHAEETRVVVVDGNKVEEFDFEAASRRQLAGNIYLAKVTRVEPSLQAAFVDYGGNRHGFLAFAEIHPDYYQIPVADRQALLAEERALARRGDDEDAPREPREPRERRESREDKDKDGATARENGRDGVAKSRRRRGRGRDKPAAEGAEGGLETADDAIVAAQDDAPAGSADAGTDDISAPRAAAPETVQPPSEPAPSEPAPSEPATDSDDDTPPSGTIAAASDNDDAVTSRDVPGMDVIDLLPDSEDEPKSYAAVDHASERDDEIESVADEDVSDELRPARRPRARRYKIQEVIKVRQIMLVQVVKEERGNKGAALTTYLSLAGRYCVLMPNTARGGGISRKITNAVDRKKLKEIAAEIEVPEGAGLIIRTAGANRTKPEIKRDYEYLFRLWEQIRDLTLKSIAPAPIYEEGNLIKRSIRDLYSKDIDEVIVEGEAGYRTAKDFMKMIMPSHAKNVKPYTDPMPLFARYQVESYLAAMFNPTVQLKSGGYIVIGVTEALVAIDINSGKSTREGSIEDTALKTNLEAADEIARQLRLRDLAGLIVIDFIDMEERKNNAAVEKRLKDALKNDRARIQVGRISGFGLLEMSRQRLRPGMLEATTQPCPHCHGTGLIRSDNSLALTILRALEEEGTRARSREVLLRAPVSIVNYLFNQKREHLAQIELRYGMAIRIEADPALVSPDYALEKFKTATRQVVQVSAPVVSLDAGTMADVDEDLIEDEADEDVTEAAAAPLAKAEASESDDGGRKKRRRRRRRRGGKDDNGTDAGTVSDATSENDSADDSDGADAGDEAAPDAAVIEAAAAPVVGVAPADEPARKPRRRTRAAKTDAAAAPAVAEEPAEPAAEAPAVKAKAPRRPRRKAAETPAEPVAEAAVETGIEAPADRNPADLSADLPAAAQGDTPVEAVPVQAPAEPEAAAPAPAPAAEQAASFPADPSAGETPGDPDKPRKRGWWSLGR